MRKGFVFSFDALLALFVLLVMVFLMVAQTKVTVEENSLRMKEFGLKSKGLLFVDSLVKNFDGNSNKGVAVFNAEKRRVESNKLDYGLLRRVKVGEFDFVKGIELEFKEGGRGIIFKEELSDKETCFVFERFVFVEEKKARVKVTVCE